jgi:hypothetical protein
VVLGYSHRVAGADRREARLRRVPGGLALEPARALKVSPQALLPVSDLCHHGLGGVEQHDVLRELVDGSTLLV